MLICHKAQTNKANKILLPPLLIKLKAMKNFVKAMDGEGCMFPFPQEKFPRISREKFKTGIFNGHRVRELIKDTMFDVALSEVELATWQSLKSVFTNFLENQWSAEYEKEIE